MPEEIPVPGPVKKEEPPTSLEKRAALVDYADTQRVRELEQLAELDFVPHTAPQVGYEYVWEKGGKRFAIKVKWETFLPVVVTSQEYAGGGNRFLESHYRGDVLIWTNDFRKAKQVEKDPGPMCHVHTPDGKGFTITVDEFLSVVNKNKARKRWYGPPVPW